ncbi:MAG: radical SAM protein [Planctomycetes bacterium]|nr:radical SAM protein [Planctomycetota bacterium]
MLEDNMLAAENGTANRRSGVETTKSRGNGGAVLSLVDEKTRRVWRMRSDDRRVVLFSCSTDSFTVGQVFVVHPQTAALLALANGSTDERFAEAVSFLFDVRGERGEEMASQFVKMWAERGVLIRVEPGRFSWPNHIPKPMPARLLMPAAQVDVERRWLYRPLELIMRLTPNCARDCRYCNVERDTGRGAMSTDEWLRVAEEAISLDVQCVLFSGGDPLLSPAVIPLIRTFTAAGIHPAIATKAYLSEEKAESLVEAGLERIQVSIDSTVSEVEDYLLNSSGATDQLIGSIRNCLRAGLSVRVNSVITPLNVLTYPRLVRFLADDGVDAFGTSQYGLSLFGDPPENFFLPPSLGRWLETKVDMLKKEGVFVAFGHVTREMRKRTFASRARCTVGESSMVVNPDGTVVPCEQLPTLDDWVVGDLRRQSLAEIWDSSELWALRRPGRAQFKGTLCETCSNFETCVLGPGVCFRNAYCAYGRIFAPDPYCPRAPEGRRIDY